MSRQAAAVREVEAHAEVVLGKLDVEPLTNPVEALLQTAGELVALKNWTSARFGEATADEQWLLAELLARNLERCSKLLVQLNGMDLPARRVQFDERMGAAIADVIAGILADAGVDPTAQHVRKAIRRHLERVPQPGYEPQPPEYWRQRYEQQREATR